MLGWTLIALAALSEPPIIDLKALNEPFEIYTDGNGHYAAVTTPRVNSDHFMPRRVFYGDGKLFYDAHAQGGNVTADDPRYPGRAGVKLVPEDEAVAIAYCGDRETKLRKIPAAERDAMLASAVFRRSAIEFEPYTLARDDNGTYYYVDRGRYDDNVDQFRVWVGPRGNMKTMKLTNVVHDSAGDIFATAKGDLRLITGNPVTTQWWAGKTKSTLTEVTVWKNLVMIYKDLGPYKNMRLGTQCDDF